jgi:hypothetical protein
MATQVATPALRDTILANGTRPTGGAIVLKTMVAHTITYCFAGLAAYTLFDYPALMSQPPLSHWIRPLTHPMVMAGPLLQPIRGVLFGFIFYLVRDRFFQRRRGWLAIWAVLVGVGILGTFGAPPSSIEGLIYSPLPLSIHLKLLPEVLVQSFVFSWLVFHWVNYPRKKWLNGLMGVLFALVLLLPAMGLATLVRK